MLWPYFPNNFLYEITTKTSATLCDCTSHSLSHVMCQPYSMTMLQSQSLEMMTEESDSHSHTLWYLCHKLEQPIV